ncbi:sodium channel protein Nach-like [Amyelois transitella]|uniref:sodium channel protein Nach-like n=1 Tax=Amyelois transitella TaxID=680683 RepID=UPI0029907C07|nr:sodium channel protein Nach-like [Amyelois transitella]
MKKLTKVKRKQFQRKRDNVWRSRNKQIRDYLRGELRSCYTQGLPYIVDTEIHWIERLFWICSFICSLGLVGSLIASQYERYFKDPVVMGLEIDYFNWNISYPAITLCADDVLDEEDLQNLANEIEENTETNLTDALKTLATLTLNNIDNLDLITFNDNIFSKEFIDPRDFRALSSLLIKKFSNDCLTTSTNWPISVNSVLTEVGMCHVLNSNVAVYDDPSVSEEQLIPYEKTNIDLSVYDKDFFIQLLDYAKEFKLFIHHPDEVILATSPSYQIGRSYTSLAVKVWSTRVTDLVHYFYQRYRKCRFLDEPISKRYPVYSYNHCLLECRIRMMLKLCRCVPHFYKYLSHEEVCDLKRLKCIKEYKNELMKLSTSERTWKRFANKDDLPKSPRDCNCPSSCESDVYLKDVETVLLGQENDRVRISITSFPKIRVMRDVIFSIYDIILRGFGVMNLIMGTSAISLMELILIITKIIVLRIITSIELGINYLCCQFRGNTKK